MILNSQEIFILLPFWKRLKYKEILPQRAVAVKSRRIIGNLYVISTNRLKKPPFIKVVWKNFSDDLVLYNKNSLNVMRKILEKHPTGCFDMIFADPPYFLSNNGCKSQTYVSFWNHETQKDGRWNVFGHSLLPNKAEKTFGKHPTQKLLTLLERCILSASNIGDLIFDPFMGSGTTGVAALKHGRKFCGCELEEDFLN